MDKSNSLQKLKESNKLAFNHLLVLHQVINTCCLFLLDQAATKVVSQKGFIKIYQSIKSFGIM